MKDGWITYSFKKVISCYKKKRVHYISGKICNDSWIPGIAWKSLYCPYDLICPQANEKTHWKTAVNLHRRPEPQNFKGICLNPYVGSFIPSKTDSQYDQSKQRKVTLNEPLRIGKSKLLVGNWRKY